MELPFETYCRIYAECRRRTKNVQNMQRDVAFDRLYNAKVAAAIRDAKRMRNARLRKAVAK